MITGAVLYLQGCKTAEVVHLYPIDITVTIKQLNNIKKNELICKIVKFGYILL
jgi:hypothetical protein